MFNLLFGLGYPQRYLSRIRSTAAGASIRHGDTNRASRFIALVALDRPIVAVLGVSVIWLAALRARQTIADRARNPPFRIGHRRHPNPL